MRNKQKKAEVSPELRAWLDRVIVPALVREFLAERRPEEMLASEGEPVVESAPTRTAIAEEGK